jgi:hypothetical protein
MDMVSAQRDLNKWHAALKKPEMETLLERLFTEGLKNKAKTCLGDSGFVSHIQGEDGFEMFDLLLDEDKKFDLSSLRGKNTVLDLRLLHSGLAANKCWQSLYPKLLTVTQKGTGEGEVLVSFIFKDVKNVKDQDINASGMHVEAKVKTANIKAHGREYQKKRTTNKAAEACGWVKNNKRYMGLWDEEDLSNIKKYLEAVYFRWDKDRVGRVAAKILELDKRQGSQYLGMEILSDYRECDGFELYIHIEPKTGKIVVIGDFDDKEFISDHLRFSVPLRGNSTQALADGYASVNVKK